MTNDNKPPFYDLKKQEQIPDLRFWLNNKKFNTFVETKDKNGSPLIGLLWDYQLGRFPSMSRKPRGLILIRRADLVKPALLTVINGLSVECEYGKCWKKAQLDMAGFMIYDQFSHKPDNEKDYIWFL